MKKHYLLGLALCLVCSLSSYGQRYKEMIESGEYSVFQIQEAAEEHFNQVGTARGVGYKPYKRWEYQAQRLMDENGMLKPADEYYNELERYNQDLNARAVSAFQGSWTTLGPTYWDDSSSQGWNPGVGRITSVAIDPGNENHVIVGGPTGGVWKSTDGGANWTVLTDNLANIDVYALTMHPTNSSIYYWGSTNGNIYRSTDAGNTWSLLADTGNGTVNKILINPNNTSILYCSSSGGIFRSTDAGINWTKINPWAGNGYDIEFKPGDTNTIYASGTDFFMSSDGGNSWISSSALNEWSQEYVSASADWTVASQNSNNTITPRTGSGMAHFYSGNFNDDTSRLISKPINLSGAVNPQLNFYYANVNWDGDVDEVKVLYKSSAGGAWVEIGNYTAEQTSWTAVTLNLPNPSGDYYIAFEGLSNWGRGLNLDDITVTTNNLGTVLQEGFESTGSYSFSGRVKMMGVSPDAPNTVYLLEENSGVFNALYKSTNSGATFTELNHAGMNYFGYSSTASDNSGQAPRDMDIAVNPNNADEVHIAGVLSWRSTNGGVNFNITSQWTPTNANNENIGYCHADIDLLMFYGSNLYVASDGGLFVAENTATINTNYYRDLTAGIGLREFYKIGISSGNSEVVTGGSQDNGSSVYTTADVWKDWLGADGMEGFVDKDNNNILYGTSQNGSLYRSTNMGTTYSGLGEPDGKSGNWVTPFEQDPTVSNRIYAGYDQVYRSNNSGGSWTAISQNFGGNLNELKIAPSNNQVMYASRGGNLYKTTTGSGTWSTLTGFSGSINSIAIHPTDPNKVAIATTDAQKGIVSTDGGANWSSYLHNLPSFSALCVVWQNNGKDGLYVGMNYGVFYIDNTFTGDWQPFSNNLPNVRVSELEINETTNKIYAGTYGRGLWVSDAFDETLSINDNVFEALTMYPNPAKNSVNLNWNVGDEVSVKVYDINGKLLHYSKGVSLLDGLSIDTTSFSNGIYVVRVNTIEAVTTKKLLINK